MATVTTTVTWGVVAALFGTVASLGGAQGTRPACSAGPAPERRSGGSDPLPLESHLRLQGTQLDLRGATIIDQDLAQLSDPAFAKVSSVLLASTQIGNAGLEYVTHLPLKELDLYRTKISDEGLKHLEGLRLERLTLSGTGVTDAGLEHVKDSPLVLLALRDTAVTAAGLVPLRGLPIRHLDLSYTRVTDVGLGGLRQLRDIETIDLSNTTVTDELLAHLEVLPNLSLVYLAATAVTPREVEKFRAARPEVRVFLDPLTR